MVAELVFTGGHGENCEGHCYCDDPDVQVVLKCPKAIKYVWKDYQTLKGVESTLVANPKRCKQDLIKIHDLGDQFSIARWITQNWAKLP